jgi:hypothetical protein
VQPLIVAGIDKPLRDAGLGDGRAACRFAQDERPPEQLLCALDGFA